MVFLIAFLADHGMDDSLKNVLFGKNTFHVFDKSVCFSSLIVLEVINDQVKARFRDNINERRKHLEGIFSTSEDDQVVSKEIIIFE